MYKDSIVFILLSADWTILGGTLSKTWNLTDFRDEKNHQAENYTICVLLPSNIKVHPWFLSTFLNSFHLSCELCRESFQSLFRSFAYKVYSSASTKTPPSCHWRVIFKTGKFFRRRFVTIYFLSCLCYRLIFSPEVVCFRQRYKE